MANKKQDELDDRWHRLLKKALPILAQTGSIGFADVKKLYPGTRGKEAFNRDGERIQEITARFKKLVASLAGHTIPEIRFADGRLELSIRGFVELLSSRKEVKRKLVAALLDEKCDEHDYLIPRDSVSIAFLGYGTTMYLFATELFKRQEFRKLSVYTASFEIAAHFYFSAPPKFATGLRRLLLPGCELNFNDGNLGRAKADFDLAIISFEGMNSRGDVYADTEKNARSIQDAVNQAHNRVIVVGDSSKFGRGSGTKIRLPKSTAEKKVFFVTDQHPPSGFSIPDGAILKVLNTD